MGEIYRLDFPNGKSYVGLTTKTAAKRYKGHAYDASIGQPEAVYCAWRKHGAPVLVVLQKDIPNDELAEAEILAIAVFGTLSPKGYNLAPGGKLSPMTNPEVCARMAATARRNYAEDVKAGRIHPMRTPEAIAKSGLSRRGENNAAKRPEVRAKMAAAKIGKTLAPEHSAKIGAAHTGKKRSAESRANMSEAQRGRVHSDETKRKIGAASLGRLVSEETRAKISAANMGRPMSDKHRAKVSAARIAYFKRIRDEK